MKIKKLLLTPFLISLLTACSPLNLATQTFEDKAQKTCESLFNEIISTERQWDLKRRFDRPAAEVERRISECKPAANKLLVGGKSECSSEAMKSSDIASTEEEADAWCRRLASTANNIGYQFPDGHNRPYSLDCKAMQEFFNAEKWNQSTHFENFEDKEFVKNSFYDRCDGGHITETSPMGTRICRGEMMVAWKSEGGFNESWHADSNQDCRWK